MQQKVLFPHQRLLTNIEPIEFTAFNYEPVIKMPDSWNEMDLTGGYDPEKIRAMMPAAGGYDEKRNNMYISPIYKNGRNIHMGFDIWMPAGTPVFSFFDGRVLSFADNDNPRDYGPTLVTEHILGGRPLYALFGHLSRESLEHLRVDQQVDKGQKLADLGDEHENGGWVPHLHLQLSYIKPETPDLPGVVSEQDRQIALECYPDPKNVLKL